MIYCVSFAAFDAYLRQQGHVRVGETDGHFLCERGSDLLTVHKPHGDDIALPEVESVCDVAGLTPPDLDPYWGD